MSNKEAADIWDAIRSIRADIKELKLSVSSINAEFLYNNYNSIVEKLDIIAKDVDTLKSK